MMACSKRLGAGAALGRFGDDLLRAILRLAVGVPQMEIIFKFRVDTNFYEPMRAPSITIGDPDNNRIGQECHMRAMCYSTLCRNRNRHF